MFAEGGLQVGHLLEVVDEAGTHLALEQRVGPEEVRHHLVLTDQPVPGEPQDNAGNPEPHMEVEVKREAKINRFETFERPLS